MIHREVDLPRIGTSLCLLPGEPVLGPGRLPQATLRCAGTLLPDECLVRQRQRA